MPLFNDGKTRTSQTGKLPDMDKNKNHRLQWFLVIPLGLEPRTHTLKVYCSTN